MLVSILSSFFLLILYKNLRIKLDLNVFVVFAFYFFMISTWFWAPEKSTSSVRVLGVLLLIYTFFSLSTLYHTLKFDLMYFFSSICSTYLFLSLVYFFLGLYFKPEMSGLNIERGFLGYYQDGLLPRMRGFMDSPNNLVLVLLSFFYIEVYRFIRDKVFSKTNFFLILCSLLLTMSTTGLFALFFSVFIYFLFRNVKVALYIILLVFFISITVYFFTVNVDDLSKILHSRIARLSTGSGRFDLFVFLYKRFDDAPYIGHGIAQVRFLLEGFQGRDLQSAHNSFLEVLIEGGVVAFVLFSFCWLSLILKVMFEVNKSFRMCVFCFMLSLILVSSANMMVYVEMMMFCLFFVTVMTHDSNSFSSRINGFGLKDNI
uniref:O-antigen ligase family protein n=1 Tax=Shewanella sp. TaxID=50422 RepID=UPI004048698D